MYQNGPSGNSSDLYSGKEPLRISAEIHTIISDYFVFFHSFTGANTGKVPCNMIAPPPTHTQSFQPYRSQIIITTIIIIIIK
jgi:hypothetical protein